MYWDFICQNLGKITLPQCPRRPGVLHIMQEIQCKHQVHKSLSKKKLLYHLTSRSRFTTKAALDTVKIFHDQNIAKITMLHYSVNEIDFGKTRKQLRKFY